MADTTPTPPPGKKRRSRRKKAKPVQGSLFASPAEIKAVKEEAMELVEEAEREAWKDSAMLAIERVARRQEFVTADDAWQELRAMGVEPPRNPAAMGPMFSRAAKEGILQDTGRIERCKRLVRHGGSMRIWRSLLYRGNGSEAATPTAA